MKPKTILITGATSGIGKATARRFARAGHNLIITGRRKEKLVQYAQKLSSKYSVKVQPLAFDLRKISEVKKAMKSLKKPWDKIDLLINNAGLAKGYDPIHEGKIEDWEIMIDTNVKGLLYMTRMIAPKMVKAKSGHIINVASTCLLYTSPSPRDATLSRMPSSA